MEAHPEAGITACAFLGDECSTLRMTDDIRELNERYYEPLAKVGARASDRLAFQPLRFAGSDPEAGFAETAWFPLIRR